MNKTVQRIVSGLLVLLVVIGLLPTVFATDTGLEELPTEPTESNESIDTTEPTQLPDTGDPGIAGTPPASSMEEEVTASRVSIGGEDTPMLFAARAAIKGTHYASVEALTPEILGDVIERIEISHVGRKAKPGSVIRIYWKLQ